VRSVLRIVAVVVGAALAGFLAGGTFVVWFNDKLTLYDFAVPAALALVIAVGRFTTNRLA
jgi:hypothetical protein